MFIILIIFICIISIGNFTDACNYSITLSCFNFFQGIERLQRREMICEEVRNALTPFYRHGEISKENYKYIYGRAVEKVGMEDIAAISYLGSWLCVNLS